MVFVHAMSFDQEIWKDVVAQMPAGYRLISLDLRGCGKSDTPPTP
ncbi:alpha/beta fold hydrolase [Cognatiyoonia sp. IB215182]